MNRKVLFVHDGPIGVYENEVYGISFKKAMIERYTFFGNEVSFLMRKRNLEYDKLEMYSKIDQPFFNFIPIPNFKSIKTFHKKYKAKTIINDAVKNHDVIIVRLPSAAGIIAFKEAKRLNKPVLVEFVACVYDALWNYDWRGKLLAHYKLKQYQNLMKHATHTIYVTNEFLQSRYPSPGKSIGCSDVELHEVDNQVLSFRLQNIKKTEFPNKLATIAAIDVSYKGQADVIKAIARLKNKGIIFKYDIIGQGDPNKLQNLIKDLNIKDLVSIKGAIPHDKIFKTLKNVDIYIQPSKQEGLPRAVIEAMSMACPVVGTKVGGIPELISENSIYEKGNIQDLCELLIKIDKNFLVENAKSNFIKAKEYRKDVLKQKRLNFNRAFMIDYNLSLKLTS